MLPALNGMIIFGLETLLSYPTCQVGPIWKPSWIRIQSGLWAGALINQLRASLVMGVFQHETIRDQDSETVFRINRNNKYGSIASRAVLKRINVPQNMSGKANPYDNLE